MFSLVFIPMKLKQIPLVLVVALAHAGGLAMLAAPRSVVEDTAPVLLSVAQIEMGAPEAQTPAQSPRQAPKQAARVPAPVQSKPAEVAKSEPQPVSAPPIAAESLVADSAPAPMIMAATEEKAESQAAIAAGPESMAMAGGGAQTGLGVTTQRGGEIQPSFQAEYLNNPKPSYPRRSLALGEEGRVMLRVHVSEQGEPVRVDIVRSSGFPRLDEAARRTVERGWRFAPARRGEQAVAGVVQVPISFALRG